MRPQQKYNFACFPRKTRSVPKIEYFFFLHIFPFFNCTVFSETGSLVVVVIIVSCLSGPDRHEKLVAGCFSSDASPPIQLCRDKNLSSKNAGDRCGGGKEKLNKTKKKITTHSSRPAFFPVDNFLGSSSANNRGD